MLPIDGRQLLNVKGELLKLKKKEGADCQLWHNVAWTEERKKQKNQLEQQRNRRLAVMRQRSQQRRAEETEEQRNSRLVIMAQRGQERRAEGTNEQRNSRLSAMLQHARERRLNVIEGQNHHQIQTFYAARTVLN
ncbi:hypothetical protein AVEN_187462-1 [Araneus ventricosus]|uniref:STPR domain-containing protein n=1 Tax=Araneus ventricosus TaxID=182803 RepID=A0A4Y2BTK9_ARAVE|nr:hypothetical protein AVEN_187462-1 [Araneus ventricosus]